MLHSNAGSISGEFPSRKKDGRYKIGGLKNMLGGHHRIATSLIREEQGACTMD